MDTQPNNLNQSPRPPSQASAPVVISSERPQPQEYKHEGRKIKPGVFIVIILVLAIVGGGIWLMIRRDKPVQSTMPEQQQVIPLTPEMERDRDLDGVPNDVEEQMGTSNQEFDTDGDGLSDQYEIEIGTDPTNVDTDGDGFLDGLEVLRGYNPNGPGNLPAN